MAIRFWTHSRRGRAGACRGKAPPSCLRKTALPLKSPTGAFIAAQPRHSHFRRTQKNPNPSPIEKRFGFSILAVVLPVDIPTGWKPRAKQQPTGLIACGAAHRRPVQVLFRTEKKKQNTNVFCFFLVRIRGLEPPPSCPD